MTTADPLLLLAAGTGFLLLMFILAWMAERRFLPRQLIDHPAVYVLSLGVFISGWGMYGVTAFAESQGQSYLSYYLGVSVAFILAPLLLRPLLLICRNYRLNSLADLLTFRFRSQWLGSATTLLLTLCMIPLFAMQIDALQKSAGIMLQGSPPRQLMPLIYCLLIIIFTVLFGSRHLDMRESHRGLLLAIAFGTLLKLVALLMVGALAIWWVFTGPGDMTAWLESTDSGQRRLPPLEGQSFRILIVTFFACAVTMPHMFHMQFAENPKESNLITAQWGLPLLLLLASLPVLPILWASQKLGTESEFAALWVALAHSDLAAAITFTGGVAAASGVMIVASIALASMWLNHLILPFYQPPVDVDIYRWLLNRRRVLIVGLVLAGYLGFLLLPADTNLLLPGIVNLVGLSHFIPAVAAVLYWPRATSGGVLTGIATGIIVSFLAGGAHLNSGIMESQLGETPPWVVITLLSLGANVLAMFIVSLLSPINPEQQQAAEVCSVDDLNRPRRHFLGVESVSEVRRRLRRELGDAVAGREVARAMSDIGISYNDRKPAAIRRLRDQLAVNLSVLLGPAVANSIIDRAIPLNPDSGNVAADDINLIERRLESQRERLTGLAADLDALRRYHRQTLTELPVGVAIISTDAEILLWNHEMERFTGVSGDDITGSRLSDLSKPWREVLTAFLDTGQADEAVEVEDPVLGTRYFNLLSTRHPSDDRGERCVIVEDITENRMLARQIAHQERLASIGRLAAGVAHEIGNPVTGIACLAQNLRYDTQHPASLETAEQIMQQTRRITSIVQSLVNFAHSGSDGQTQALTAVDAAETCRGAVKLLELDVESGDIQFVQNGPDSCPALADEQRLMQIVINLLTNARDASPRGSEVCITLELEPERVLIHVSDRGDGIPETLRERIFEPFFTTKDPGKGTGLGLALCYRFVEEFGGELSVTSPWQDDRGSRFTVKLRRPTATKVDTVSG